MTTIIRNLYINQGSTFTATIALKQEDGSPFDLSNYSVRSEFRKSYTSATAYTFTCEVVDNPEDGQIELSLSAADSREIASGRYLYDVEICTIDNYIDDLVYRVVEGQIEISPQITRSTDSYI